LDVKMRVRVLAAVVGALGVLFTPGATAQPAGPCRVLVNGEDAGVASTPKQAIRVDADGELKIAGSGFEGPAAVSVELDFGLVKRTVFEHQVESAETWRTSINVRDYARFGVGLYHVVATSDQCHLDAWVRVVGRSPFRTVAGIASALLLVLGLALIAMAVALGGLVFAALAGVAAGVGALILAQQLGFLPLTTASLIISIGAGAVVGGAAKLLASVLHRRLVSSFADKHKPPGGHPQGPRKYKGGELHDVIRHERPTIRPPDATRMEEPPAPVAAAYEEPMAGPPSPPTELSRDVLAPGEEEIRMEGPIDAYPAEDMGEVIDAYPAEPAAGEPEPAGQAPMAGVGATIGVGRMEPRPGGGTYRMEAQPPARQRDPPRSAYALLKCPDVVVAQREFELTAGLSEKPTPGVSPEPMVRPPSSVGPYLLTIHVVAEGFTLRAGESWRQELRVTAKDPYPTVALHLVPKMPASDILPKKIRATYAVDGQIIGDAVRSLAVVPSEAQIPQAKVEEQELDTDIAVPVERTAPDLTVVIRLGESEGRLLWTFESPHREIDVPDIPVEVNIGANPEQFARQLVDQVNAKEGRPGVYQELIGIGTHIADKMPVEFWEMQSRIAAEAAKQRRAPTILILSQEPYIPWELAVIEPLIDPEAPPFLAAQANVGRWILGGRKPKLPPPLEIQVADMAVVAGVYNKPGWKRLEEAESEAKAIVEKYGAVGVDANTPEVLLCIAGTPDAEVVHFALHGVYDPTSVLNGLVLVDGLTIGPNQVRGSVLPSRPFVFLNACQVGSGNKILGDYAGMAEAFLYAGAAGLVAPLWSIKDSVAKEIALHFYDQTFAGAAPADVLRRERARFGDSPGTISATYLAYQFFGHPAMKLTRVG
jgi:CHAT domain